MNQPSRRAVLRAGLVAATAAALPFGVAGSAYGGTSSLPATRLLRRVFRPHAGTTFLLMADNAEHLAELVAVSDPSRPQENRFSLLFKMVGGARPDDGIYSVSHPRLKAIDLYIGAIGRREDGIYEAVINS